MSADGQHPRAIEHMSMHLHAFYEAKGAPLSLPTRNQILRLRLRSVGAQKLSGGYQNGGHRIISHLLEGFLHHGLLGGPSADDQRGSRAMARAVLEIGTLRGELEGSLEGVTLVQSLG